MFRNNIEASTQMQAVLTSHSKPNCLIIDEIDGAPTVSGRGAMCTGYYSLRIDANARNVSTFVCPESYVGVVLV